MHNYPVSKEVYMKYPGIRQSLQSKKKQAGFSREHIETMKDVWVWQQICSEGYRCSSWVNSIVAPVVDAKGDAGSVIEKFLTPWSLSVLSDFRFDIIFAELFRFRGGTWLNDGAIRPSLCISSHVRE
ncbi:hypothetical protein GQ600_3527 [Phytophthora cactorum]|nr:hypothetical protein GQ600_3527 [Phytophthora cactorum]